MKAWITFLKQLEKELGKDTITQWLRPLRILRFDARNLHLEADDSFQILWFKEHVALKAKKQLLTNNAYPIQIHFYLHGDPYNLRRRGGEVVLEKKEFFSSDHLESHARFETFIVEKGPNLPLQVLLNFVQQGKEKTCNPIYIYGPKGTGKSHLLMATAHALKEKGETAFYVKSKTFTNHVVRAFRSGFLQAFRQAYRDPIDTLIIDDVHLFSRKTATQEELFHTFNHFHTTGRQIILSGNCPPHLLRDIEERLVSRFEWGLTLSLPPLCAEQKKMVLSEKLLALSLPLSQPLQDYLIETFRNLHTLTRAIEALALRNHQSKHSIDLEVAQILLKDLIEKENASLLSPEKILKNVAKTFGISTTDILSRSQSKECVLPRQVSMYLCRTELKMPYLKIGALFSRDHSTVMSSVRQITKRIEQREETLSLSMSEIRRHLHLC